MACRRIGAKPSSEPMLDFVIRNSKTFIQENAFESVVCEMAAVLSRP